MRELDRIRAQREEDKARREREAAELAGKREAEGMLRGNPLLPPPAAGGGGAGGIVKRRFGEDTVFSRTHAAEPEVKKRFINDVIRSDFHRSFLRKFIQ